jgi:hypothetical protein
MKSLVSKLSGGTDPLPEQSGDGTDKEVGVGTQAVRSDSESDDAPTDAQAGVQDIEAITKVWSKTHLIMAYIM